TPTGTAPGRHGAIDASPYPGTEDAVPAVQKPAVRSRLLEGQAGEDHHLLVGEVGHRGPQALAADTGLLDPAVRHLVGAVGRHVADNDPADLQLPVRPEGDVEAA